MRDEILAYYCIHLSAFDHDHFSGWCVASDKSILQGIGKAVGSKMTPAWTSTGDPCTWSGITCDSAGYVIQINMDEVALSGIYIYSLTSRVSFYNIIPTKTYMLI